MGELMNKNKHAGVVYHFMILIFAIGVISIWFSIEGQINSNNDVRATDATKPALMAAPSTNKKLVIDILKPGTGNKILSGNTAVVHYTGTLPSGIKFDSSYDHKNAMPFKFKLGSGQVIKGWELGVKGMKVGEKRKLTIPSEMAYGAAGKPGKIPPGSTLFFTIELMEIIASSSSKIKDINNQELSSLMKRGVKVIDIRRKDEWKSTGVIKNSILITLFDENGRPEPDFLKKLLMKVDKKEEIIVICRTGNRTMHAAKWLTEAVGFNKVYNVKNGISNWIKSELPVTNK